MKSKLDEQNGSLETDLLQQLTKIVETIKKQLIKLQDFHDPDFNNIIQQLNGELSKYERYQDKNDWLTKTEIMEIKNKYQEINDCNEKKLVEALQDTENPVKEYEIDSEIDISQDKTLTKLLDTFFFKNKKTNKYHIYEHPFRSLNSQEKVKDLMKIYTEISQSLTNNNQENTTDTTQNDPNNKEVIKELLEAVDDYIIQHLQRCFSQLQNSFEKGQQYSSNFKNQFTTFKARWNEIPNALKWKIENDNTIQEILFGSENYKITTFLQTIKNSQSKITFSQTPKDNTKPKYSSLDINPYRGKEGFTVAKKINDLIKEIDTYLKQYEIYVKQQAIASWDRNISIKNMVKERKEKTFQGCTRFDRILKTKKYQDAVREWHKIQSKLNDGSAFQRMIEHRMIRIKDGKLKTETFNILKSDGTFGVRGDEGNGENPMWFK